MAIVVALLVVSARSAQIAWRCRRPTRHLDATRPQNAWCLRNFASRRPGAGTALLHRVSEEADMAERTFYLDTTAPRLLAYYEVEHFTLVGQQEMDWGTESAIVYRMVRRPDPHRVAADSPD